MSFSETLMAIFELIQGLFVEDSKTVFVQNELTE